MPYKVTIDGNSSVLLEDKQVKDTDLIALNDNQFHAIFDHKTYKINVISVDINKKELVLVINNGRYTVKIEDELDLLLDEMGFSKLIRRTVEKIESPMPGLVLEINVSPGQAVSEGDRLLILEAMKMENIIKSPTQGIIKEVLVKPGDNISKGELLIRFENE